MAPNIDIESIFKGAVHLINCVKAESCTVLVRQAVPNPRPFCIPNVMSALKLS